MTTLSLQEDFALNPASRPQLVKDLTPNTEEYYVYRLRYLSQQLQTGEVPVTAMAIEEAQALLNTAENSDVVLDSRAVEQLKTQLAFLAYPVKPDPLLKRLNLDPAILQAIQGVEATGGGDGNTTDDDDETEADSESRGVENLPTALDPALVSTETMTEKLLEEIQSNIYSISIPRDSWPHLLAQPKLESIVDGLDPDELFNLFQSFARQFSPSSLEIIGQADSTRIDLFVVKTLLRLYKEQKVDFSNNLLQISQLTRAQLEWLKKEDPSLMDNEGFVGLLENRIVPEPFAADKDAAYKEWLDRMVVFVDGLSPKFERYKVSVYLLSLTHDLKKGTLDKAKFLRYVVLSRGNSQPKKKANDKISVFQQPESDAPYWTLSSWSTRVPAAKAERHDEVEEEYLSHFIREAKSAAEFEPYYEVNDFLNPLLARIMLTSGDKDLAKWSNMLSKHENLSSLTKQTILKFAQNNPSRFLPSDAVVFKLRTKNAPKILVRVFEVKTFDYLQQHESGFIGEKLNLDGLTPNWEHTLVQQFPALESHEIMIELPELANKRGAFVMDVISNGESSSAYFTKGYLDFIERQSVAGHVLTIIDENQQKLTDKCSVWINGHYYRPNGDGDIIVPYRKASSASDSRLYLIHDGFATRRPFTHRIEHYDLKLACHIDHESLVAGATSKIVLKPTVQIDGVVNVPVNLLEQVELTIDYVDTNIISSKTTVPDFKIHDVDWSEYTFHVPENLESLSITLSAKIKVICSGDFQDLAVIKQFTFESPSSDESVNFEIKGNWDNVRIPGELLTVLRKNTDGYRVLALGKNGERRANIPLEFDISHPIWTENIKVYLRTDNSGQLFLGHLQDIDYLTCNTTTMKWNITEQDQHVYPSTIHSIEGEVVSIPIANGDVDTIRKVALFSTTEKGDNLLSNLTFLDDYTKNVHYENGLLSIKGLKAGYYVFLSDIHVQISIVVASSKTTRSHIQGLEDFIVGSNPMLELLESAKLPLYISPSVADGDQQKVSIQLYNWSPETRVCILASKFVPYGDRAFNNLNSLNAEEPWWMNKTLQTSTAFKSGRVLGEEYQYVLNRKAHTTRWAGNLLTKPSTLLTPRVVAETTQSVQAMRAGIDFATLATTTEEQEAMIDPVVRCLSSRQTARKSSYQRSRAPPTLNFLANPSVALINLTPDPASGVVSVPFSALKDGSFLQVVASDGHQILQQSFVVPRLSAAVNFEFQKRDLRFKSQLDHTKHYIGERTGVDLDPKAPGGGADANGLKSITLASNGSSSAIRVINSVSQVYDMMLTLLPAEDHKQTLRKFGFVADWGRLSSEAKKEKFSKWNCHELNLFLYKKDKPFFDAVVAPFLKNKLMKSFMDNYLIGAPLDSYAALQEFNQLTCMEKCLLAQRLPALKPAVVRWMKDRVHNARGAGHVKLFQTVMNSGNLKEATDKMDYDEKEESDEDMGFGLFDDVVVKETITHSADNYDMLESAPGGAPMMAMAYAAPAAPMMLKAKKKMAFGNVIDERSRSERIVRNQFKPVDLTKEMGETYYYDRDDFKKYGHFDEANLFWLDLAQWDESKGSFLSQNFVVNTGNFTDAMATLALLDVTFRPKGASLTRSPDQNLIITSQAPAIVFHSSTKELLEAPVTGTVLVTQHYFEQCEKTTFDEVLMTQVRKYIQPGQEFRPLESYGAHVVLMNGSPNPMKVHLEVQIPQGAISIYGSLESGHDIELRPHATFQYEYGFYFPEQGDFPHYPAHVSNYEDIIAFASPAVLKVREPAPDRQETLTNTWGHILKNGNREDILTKLEASPLSSLPIDQLVPRLYKDRQLLKRVTLALRSRQEYDSQIWSAAFAVQNEELIKEYLMNRNPLDFKVGDWFTSSFYTRRPHCRFEGTWDDSFKYLEYFPLINSRTHKATRTATILNDKFREQYDHILRLLSEKPKHDVDDLLVLIVYLLAQDRITEAKDRFKELHALINSTNEGASREYFQQLQYDYLWAYLSLCVEVPADVSGSELDLDVAGVQAILDKYQDYPVERWSKMFKEMQLYVDEINQSLTAVPDPAGSPVVDGAASETNSNAEEDDGEDDTSEVPITVDFKIGAESVVMVRHRGVHEVTVEYYSIDAEAMFSASPLTFSDQGENSESSNSSRDGDASNSYRLVKPNGIDTHNVKRAVATDGLLMIPILPQYLNSNVMVSVTTSPPAANRTWKAYYSQTIVVQTLEQTGTIKVISKTDNGRPIRGGYVKVYAEMKQRTAEGSTTAFWKDGYTDLVGRFAYAQVSTGASPSSNGGGGLGDVKRFVVFVDGGREGCVVKTVPVPPV
ncbi:hypothetical protein K457DRAFT_136616 [Linnemannia elongata AG-77]|uniref:Uncharacterized protein n=1 Tax=Linnemannia elongata AG-77 TaxID=1314771 RepID=A0A197K1A0_9FUNG|nr:hypothetical protein K457DRAFT_136616 [Linnemannia elongata AG-77]